MRTFLIALAALSTLPACDDQNAVSERDSQAEAVVSLEAKNLRGIANDEDPAALKEQLDFELQDAVDPAYVGPPGTACCANCGEYWDGWHLVGYVENCNGHAASFCSSHGWSLINAEWRVPLDPFTCY